MVQLSPGVAASYFELLKIIDQHGIPFSEIGHSFGRVGVAPIDKALAGVQALRWVSTNEYGVAALTISGSKILDATTEQQRLRRAIIDYVDIVKPTWLQNAPFGRKKVLLYAGNDIFQTFLEADLVSRIDKEVVAFWDSLAAKARGQRQDLLQEIGREGERLTIEYEKRRTGKHPKWISIESNEDGYDVLSVVDRENRSSLSIEVKATKSKYGATFHITRNEWERTLEISSHLFHLWDISLSDPKLAILNFNDIEPHIAQDKGDGCWEAIRIHYDVFRDRFESIPTLP